MRGPLVRGDLVKSNSGTYVGTRCEFGRHAGKKTTGCFRVGTALGFARGSVFQSGHHRDVLAHRLQWFEDPRESELATRGSGQPLVHHNSVGYIHHSYPVCWRCVSIGSNCGAHRIEQWQGDRCASSTQQRTTRQRWGGDRNRHDVYFLFGRSRSVRDSVSHLKRHTLYDAQYQFRKAVLLGREPICNLRQGGSVVALQASSQRVDQ